MAQTRPLAVRGDYNYPPFEFLDESGMPAGYNVDLFRAVAGAVNLDYDLKLQAWDKVRKELENGEIDILMGMFRSRERDRFVDFSLPHLIVHHSIFVRKGSPIRSPGDLEGKKIIVQHGDIMDDYLKKMGLSENIVRAKSQPEALKQLASGENDCFLGAKQQGLYTIEKLGLANLIPVGPPLELREYGFAVAEGNEALLARLNEGMQIIRKNGEFDKIYSKWFPIAAPRYSSAKKIAAYAALILIPLCLVLAGSLTWSRSLKKKVLKRTEQLRLELEERNKAEKAMRESEEQLRTLINAIPDIICFKDGQGRWLQANEFDLRLFGLEGVDYQGKKDSDLVRFSPFYREAFLACEETDEQAWAAGGPSRSEKVIPSPDGLGRTFDIIKVPTFHQDGSRKGLVVVGRDISGRIRAKEKLQEAYEIIRRSPVVAFLWENVENWPVELVTENVENLFGYTAEEFTSGSVQYADTIHPDDLERVAGEVAAYSREPDRLAFDHQPYRIITRDGKVKWVDDSTIIRRTPQGEITHYQGILTDITERIRAQEESERLQVQLIQGQKMEAIGRLAGGVAHDFNNMINIIIGYADLGLMDVPREAPLRESLEEILKAAKRSADLTRQLLGFARKQTISPRPLVLNESIAQCEKMLRRLIGEEIELRFTQAPEAWLVKMDPSQLDQVLANLAANARDAISGPGTISIETSNASLDEDFCAKNMGAAPGEYVKISFSDSGGGIDPQTRERIFEPFFTTKDDQEGTGLGLATVYGIITQNKGFIRVMSEPGQGTTFSLFLPRYLGEASGAEPAQAEEPPTGTETILVVEDESQILKLCRTVLERQGYRVLTAKTPGEAIRACEKHGQSINLLLTDVIMPEMNGKRLQEELLAINPKLKTLFMSGYSADAISSRGVLARGVLFLPKPFTPKQLATRVRDVLGKLGP